MTQQEYGFHERGMYIRTGTNISLLLYNSLFTSYMFEKNSIIPHTAPLDGGFSGGVLHHLGVTLNDLEPLIEEFDDIDKQHIYDVYQDPGFAISGYVEWYRDYLEAYKRLEIIPDYGVGAYVESKMYHEVTRKYYIKEW